MSDPTLEDLTEVAESIDDDLFHLRRPSATGDQDKVIKKQNFVSKTVTEIVLAESVSGLKIVAFNTSGLGVLADITDTNKTLLAGINIEDGIIAATIKCQKVGEFVSTAHGLTIGQQYYLGTSGLPVLRSAVPANVSSIPLFIVKDANTLDINVGQLESSNFNNGSIEQIGHIKWSYSRIADAGYLPVALNNAVSQVSYAVLYNLVGDSFEAEHVAAGDPASGAGMFYPTPTPGRYTRAGLNIDIEVLTSVFASDYITVAAADYNRLNSLRGSGLPIKLTLVSGTLTGGLTAETEYWLGFLGSNQIAFYSSEDDAISDTSKETLTDANVGTFTFHQDGITFSHSLEIHRHYIMTPTEYLNGRSMTDDGASQVSSVAAGVIGSTNVYAEDLETGTETTETRPSTSMAYAYIKALEVDLTSGLAVSSIKYDSGWIANSDWTNAEFLFTHNLGLPLSDLIYRFLVSTDGTDSNSFVLDQNTIYSGGDYGLSFLAIDDDSFKVQTATNGPTYIQDSGVNLVLNTQSYYYKCVVYAPQLTIQVFEPKYFYDDLSSGPAVRAIPNAVDYIGERTYEWDGGSIGGNNLTFTTYGGQTIGDELASVWVGEHKGIMTLISDGVNWRVKIYEDSYRDTTDYWVKKMNGDLIQGKYTFTNTGPTNVNLLLNFIDLNYAVKITLNVLTARIASYVIVSAAVYQVTAYISSTGAASNISMSLEASGKWK